MDSPTTPLSLDDLARETGESPRTIRFWIQEGLLPAARGTGRAAYYDEEHLARLQFVVRVREQIGPKLPLAWLRETLDGLWASNPAIVARVGRGEEPLHIAGFGPLRGHAAAPLAPSSSAPSSAAAPSAAFPSKRPVRPAASERGWTTIQIRGDLELRMRTDDPERVAWLARIARRLRAWIEEGEQ
jgi:DNA-binding transcriptional MerR regulator